MNISYIDNVQEWQNEFVFSIKIKVRFSETDMFGHMNNTVPFIYFEQVRIGLLQSLGINLIEKETIPVVLDIQCHFLQQVYFDDELLLYAKINNVGITSVDIHYMGVRNEKICFVGRGKMVNINKDTGKSIEWSDEIKSTLRR